MVRQSLSPWLADFISAEVAQVINWKHSLSNNIKPDPDSRFEDDGSNFRSVATDLPSQCSLQLIEVSSIEDIVTAIVSDGHNRVKARLSEDAVATLEAEAEAQFSLSMTNDVFQPRKVTVISTPFGPPDGFIQLYIDGIEYEHHLRRAEGQPLPVEENDSIRYLIDDITKIRCTRLPHAENSDDEMAQTQILALKSPTSALSQAMPRRARLEPSAAPVTVSVPRSPPPASAIDSQAVHNNFQTQQYGRRKQTGPSLAKDGFEVESGVNLHRPVQANSNNAPITNVSGNTVNDKHRTDHLLGLLGMPTGAKRPRESSPPVAQSPAVVSETPDRTTSSNTNVFRETADPSLTRPASSAAAPPSAQQPPKQTPISISSSGRSSFLYGRRKIPSDQRRLLDSKDSWLPPLPGQSFPAPSVPIELIKKWNAPVPRAAKQAEKTHHQENDEIEPIEAEPQSRTDDSEESSDSEEEFGQSQWPPSSPLAAPELPPDSSFDNVVRGTQQDDLEVTPPHTMTTRPSVRSPNALKHPLPAKPPQAADSSQSSPRRPPRQSQESPAGSAKSFGSQRLNSFNANVQQSQLSQPSPRSSERHDRQASAHSTPQALSAGSISRPGSVGLKYFDNQQSPMQFQQRPRAVGQFDGTMDDSPSQRSVPSGSLRGQNPTRRVDSVPKSAAPNEISTAGSSRAPRAMMASSPPRGPRAMSGQSRVSDSQPSPIGVYSQEDPMNRSRPSATALPLDSPFRNQRMVGRRQSRSQNPSPSVLPESIPNGSPIANSMQGRQQSPALSLSSARDRPAVPTTRNGAQHHRTEQTNGDHPTSEKQPSLQHPDNQYQDIRRQHIQHYTRTKWVEDYYRPDPSGNTTFEGVFHAYRVYHRTKSEKHEKNDHTLNEKNFAEAVQEAFPDEKIPPEQMMFSPKRVLKRIMTMTERIAVLRSTGQRLPKPRKKSKESRRLSGKKKKSKSKDAMDHGEPNMDPEKARRREEKRERNSQRRARKKERRKEEREQQREEQENSEHFPSGSENSESSKSSL